MLSGSCYRFVLLGLCISLLRQWCEWKGEGQVQDKTSCNLAVKHLLHGHLRKTRLWRRVVGETRHSRGKGRPAWFLLGILLLSGDVELNPGPKTRTADKDYASPPTTSPSSNLSTAADHFKVTQVLKALDNKQLIHLGTALGLEYPHLKRMQTLPENMVAAWLNMEDKVMDTSGTPTWSSLVKALEDTNQKDVASRIEVHKGTSKWTEISVNIIKGPLGFGFSLGESALGPVVKLIMDHPRCAQLQESDIILEVNGETVKHYLHNDLVTVLKSCPMGKQATFLVRRPYSKDEMIYRDINELAIGDENEFTTLEIHLVGQESGFGFWIKGGSDEGSQASVAGIVAGGAADMDGRLLVGDEIIWINYHSTIDGTHRDIISLMVQAAALGEVILGIRRKLPPNFSSEPSHCDNSGGVPQGPRDVVIKRPDLRSSFGFVVQSNTLRPGCMICRLTPDSPASRSGLYIYDELLTINGRDVSHMDHENIVTLIKASSTQINLTVQQPYDDKLVASPPSSATSEESDWEEIHHIEFQRIGRGFGFSIRGGAEYNAPLCILRIADGSPADKDGRLRVGDELLEINGNSTEGMLHCDAVIIIKLGGDRIYLVIRRQVKEYLNFFLDPLHGEIQRHKEACIKIIEEKLSVDIDIIRLVYFGLPRSGKTSTMRRLMGDMLNILIAMKEKEEPSTGVADVKQIFVRNIYSEVGTIISSKWSRADLQEEAAMLTQFFYQVAEHSAAKNPSSQGKPPSTGKEESSPPKARPTTNLPVNEATAQISPTTDFSTSNPSLSSASNPLSSNKETSRDKGADIDEMFSAFEEAIKTNSLDKVKYLLEDTTLLINTDTGGHAEFLEMHAALVMGPSLYLLFSRLTDKLESLFKVYYTNEEGKSSEKEDSTLTMEEVFFQALSSIACFSGSSPDVSDTVSGAPAENCKQTKYCTSHSESKALFVGTHLDKINQRKLKKKDELLQKKVTCTSFYTKGIIERASEDQLMLAVNNYSGGQEEIEEVRNILDRIIKNRFKKIRIPAAWLMLSLYIRRKDLRVMTLDECARLAAKLGIDPQEELQEALWFLHHCVGLILYYPKLDVLKDTVICDVQVIFDSVTKLIKNTFTLDKVTPTRVDDFREKAQFTMEDIENSASSGTDATIPLDKLVKLLEYLNILTRFTPTKVRSGEVTYFMPSILKSARADDLKVHTSRKDPAPLMLRYNCGYVPFGVFSYMITNIVSKQTKWRLIEDKIWKNKVQFHVGSDYDKVALISRPLYIEVVVSRSSNPQTPTKVLCAHIRQVVLSTLKIEKNFTRDFKFAFECPAHSGRDHLCVLASETARQMECLKNPKKIQPIPLKDSRCMVWFEESSTDDERHASEATPQSLGDSLPANMDEKELRSDDHGEVLDSVKSLSAQWRRLSSKLGLEISSLDRIEKDNPGDCMMCLDKALVEWLNLNYNCSKHGRPSWKRLATAVKDLDYALFEKIVKEHQAETTSC